MRGIRKTKSNKYETYCSYEGYKSLGTYDNLSKAKKVVKEHYYSIFGDNIKKLNIPNSEVQPIYDSKYYATKCGKVLNEFGEEMIGTTDKCGYHQIILSDYNGVKNKLVHRLVLSTFNPIVNMVNLDVNHIDGNKLNNKLKNLEWCTRSENVKHSFTNYLQTNVGNQYGKFKVATDYEIKQFIILRDKGYSYQKIGDMLGFSRKTVSKYCKRGGRY